MRNWLAALAGGAWLMAAASGAWAQDKVTFGLDWLPQAEHGGFFQAAANGIYRKHNLDVTIRPGGPQVNHTQLLIAGRLDFNMTSNSFLALNFVRENIPFRVVAALFQKDPSVLIAHPNQGNDTFPQLKGKPILISSDTRAGWWNFLRVKFGYTDAQIRPYTFNLAPFLADKSLIQQGYLGSEPFSIRQATGIEPVVLLIADAGYTGYANLIGVSDRNIKERPDLVRRFVDATIEGWYSYLYGDPAPGNAAIRAANPEMTQALIDYGRAAMLRNGIVDSGDALQNGIGAINPARFADFHRTMAAAGLYPATLDVARAYTTEFVNRKVGMNLKR